MSLVSNRLAVDFDTIQARHELNSGDPKKAEFYMNQADSINDQEPLVKIVRGICKVSGDTDTYRVIFMYGRKVISYYS